MVERVRLLIELTSFSYEGSNPSFSATYYAVLRSGHTLLFRINNVALLRRKRFAPIIINREKGNIGPNPGNWETKAFLRRGVAAQPSYCPGPD